MPKAHSLSNRETVDLHADWWSPDQDAAGRYYERVVVYAQMLQADQEWIQAKVLSQVKVGPQDGQATRPGEAPAIDLGGAEKTRVYLFLRMIREMTDETGEPQPLTEATFAGLLAEDANYLEQQINLLNAPLIRVTPQDERQAALNSEINAEATKVAKRQGGNPQLAVVKPTDPSLVAEDNFRRRR